MYQMISIADFDVFFVNISSKNIHTKRKYIAFDNFSVAFSIDNHSVFISAQRDNLAVVEPALLCSEVLGLSVARR